MIIIKENSIFNDELLICNYSFDKRQNIYIAKHESNKYKKGYKFLYGNTPKAISIQIEKFIKNG